MKNAFSLIELIVVIVVMGILVTIGLANMGDVIDRGRSAEGLTNLGALRKQESMYYQEHAKYASTMTDLGLGLPEWVKDTSLRCRCGGECTSIDSADCRGMNPPDYYFQYTCDSNGTCHAYRCTRGGKPPTSSFAYDMELDINGKLVINR